MDNQTEELEIIELFDNEMCHGNSMFNQCVLHTHYDDHVVRFQTVFCRARVSGSIDELLEMGLVREFSDRFSN